MHIGKRAAASLLAFLLSAPVVAAEPPRRVVSINLCTDQLAMLVAGERQLHSVSALARDPESSAMSREAAAYRVNHGLAEEIFAMRPDLVLAGSFSARSTVELLRKLGLRVEEFAPAVSLDEIGAHILRMGELLGRSERAAALAAGMEEELTRLAALPPSAKRAVAYSSNAYATGSGTLTDAAMEAAGLRNMAAEAGIVGGARMPLEMLVLARPDLVVTGTVAYDDPALAQEQFVHPAFRGLVAEGGQVNVPDGYWLCGGPFTLQAVRILAEAAGRGD